MLTKVSDTCFIRLIRFVRIPAQSYCIERSPHRSRVEALIAAQNEYREPHSRHYVLNYEPCV